jgi:hypothetical protein
VDLVVNRQLWSLFDYIERYGFIHKFGSVARDYNYDLRVFNRQGEILATFTCNYSVTPPNCGVRIFDSLGQRGFGSEP